jgi:hypothetical protein
MALTTLGPLRAGPIRTGFDTDSLPKFDDASSGPATVGFGVNFYGTTYRQLYVNENGNVTFGSPLGAFSPVSLGQLRYPMLAPFFADVDHTAAGAVTFGAGTVNGHAAFAATWAGVGYYSNHADRLNDFQVVLVDRSDTGKGNFDAEFNYARVQWESGDFSGGIGGLGGSAARAGFTDGNGKAVELPGSGVAGSLLDGGPPGTALARNLLNSDVAGRYVFSFRDGVPEDGATDGGGPVPGAPPPPTPPPPPGGPVGTPEPATAVLAATGLGAAACGVRRRRG